MTRASGVFVRTHRETRWEELHRSIPLTVYRETVYVNAGPRYVRAIHRLSLTKVPAQSTLPKGIGVLRAYR